MIEDRQLSEHFRLYQLTRTDHAQYQEWNREVNEDQIEKLIWVASLWEIVINILDCPVVLTSGYRCQVLNRAVGSTDRSQHMLCEAADGVPVGIPVEKAFRFLLMAAKLGKFQFGQLIYEKADRGYTGKTVEWIHLSLGYPFRPLERSGQILTMADGKYNLIETIRQKKEAL